MGAIGRSASEISVITCKQKLTETFPLVLAFRLIISLNNYFFHFLLLFLGASKDEKIASQFFLCP